MAGSDSFIVVEDLIKAYEGRVDLALKGINLQVKEGECFGLLGPNGAGKTTLMGCLLGLLNPDGGKITIGGLDPNDFAVREVIGFLPERPNFENWLTAREFLNYHHALSGGSKSTRKSDVENMLQKIGLQEDAWSRKTGKFSRGMLQRLGLGQALISNPKVVFLDEPGSGMDPPGVTLLREILQDLKRNNATIVLNSHHLDEMERICDRVAFIKNGQIQSIKTMTDESDYPHVLKMRFARTVERVELAGREELGRGELAGRQELFGREELETILRRVASETDSTLLEFENRGARIAVKSGQMASLVIRKSIENGLNVQSASPESTSLEHLFTQSPSADERGS